MKAPAGYVYIRRERRYDVPYEREELIVCEDCKYVFYDESFDRYWCNRTSGIFDVQNNDFCSRAKKREAE